MKKFAIAFAFLAVSVGQALACDGACAVVLKASDGYWNLRSYPNGKVLTRLYRGDTVEILHASGPWSRVAVNNSDFVGWVYTDGLQEIPCR
jgi:hypothetical protein